jgi:hypothetical protein
MSLATGGADPGIRVARRLPLPVRALISACYGLAIGTAIAFLNDQDLFTTLVYSLCISVLCWLCLDVGRQLVARWMVARRGATGDDERDRWPGWPWMLVIIGVGSAIAYTGGTALADAMLGVHTPGLLQLSSPREALVQLLFCLVPAAAISYYFYSRGVLANREQAIALVERQAAENRLKLLEAQLEPHMLFNTLANLRVLIALDPPRAQAMLDQLVAFLRATLSGSRAQAHPLREEFARIEDYLALMRVRMDERLQTRLELPEELAGLPVPPLLLQPLVENCIKHGLEPALAGGRIELSAAREGRDLVLRVRDSGVGLTAATGEDPARFGLRQVRERLATLYGTSASLTLEAAPGGGALATVRLPLPASA